MALYAFDGTWNNAKDNEDDSLRHTNVFRFYQAYRKHSNTDDFYLEGVGTRFGAVGRVFGGVFGLGELARINEAYDHLCKAWADGDQIIDIVGFSRGAATTLDFCHRIQKDGIRRPDSDDVVEPQPRIRFLGVWDIVAAFGLANLGDDRSQYRPPPVAAGVDGLGIAFMRWRSTSGGRRFCRRGSTARTKSGSAACTRTSAAATPISA